MSQPSNPLEISLPATLRRQAAVRPDHVAYRFLEDGEVEGASLTFAQLERRVHALAATLHREGAAGERVLLLYPPGLDFVVGFLGCLAAGAVAVPAYPPRIGRADSRLESIARNARPRFALTNAALLGRSATVAEKNPALAEVRWIAAEEIDPALADLWAPCDPHPDEPAFLQYTSGSTSEPKGVVVSHGNLAHNERMIQLAFGQSEDSVVVGWLPLYHDMGLIGNVLQPLWTGATCVLMAPAAFLQKPARWLQAISRYRATTSGGPDFAYALCAQRVREEEKAGLDLSSWTVAFNGAEPVRAETLEHFAAAFASQGFRREAFYPCYGLAEATLFVSGGQPGVAPAVRSVEAAALEQGRAESPTAEGAARELVSCGRAWMGQTVEIVDPESGAPCQPGRVGEIRVQGPSVTHGYWERPEQTAAAFGRAANGERWLRTGDLGFVLDGELFVTGRIKDLIILRGRNLYPQDVERTAERSHPAVRAGCVAAFAAEVEGEERLVVACEVERTFRGDRSELADAVRAAVAEEHEARVHEVVLLRLGGVPKTSSGKIRRSATRAAWLDGSLDVIGATAPAAPVEIEPVAPPPVPDRDALLALPAAERQAVLFEYLRHRAAKAARVPASAVRADRPLTALGLDSLGAVELRHTVETELGASLPFTRLLEGATLDELVAELSLTAETSVPLVRTAEGEAEHPLSWGQRSLLFLERRATDARFFTLAGAARVRGGFDPDTFARALTALTDRHPALRTTFADRDGEPVQIVHPRLAPEILVEDAAGLDDAALRARIEAEVFRPFDLVRGPLLRAGLFQLGQGEQALFLAVHHLVSDLWSLATLLREFEALYADPEAELPPAPVGYTDYVRWQRERLAGPEGERLWEAWRERLAGHQPVLELPTDRPRPAVQSYRGAARGLRLDRERTAAVQALARAQGTTLYTPLLTAFQLLLSRWSGQERLLLGTPTNGRTAAELAGVVGYFVSPVVVRADLSGAPSFAGLLARVRRETLAAFDLQDFPFALLPERLQLRRDPSRSPLFQVFFVLEQARGAGSLGAFALGQEGVPLRLAGQELTSLPLETRSAQFDLMLLAAEVDGTLALSLEHNPDLFDAATIDRMLGHYAELLAAAAARPATPVTDLPMLTAAEQAELLAPPVLVSEPTAALHQLFEAQADRRPDAPAVTFDIEELSYRQLDERANRLARRLRRLGAGPETPVCLCLERSLDLVAAVLATVKAGAAYVPLDPASPPERLALLLEDAGRGASPLLVATERALSGLPEEIRPAGDRLVLLDRHCREIAAESAERLAVETSGGHLAYVIYTSGSTGRPKGVQITHGQAVRLFTATEPWFGFGPDDVWTLFHSYAFDFSVWEMWGALLYGGRLVVVPRAVTRAPEDFLELLASERVTVLNQTPSAFRQLIAAWQSDPRRLALRTVVFGGEALEPRSLKPWTDAHGFDAPRLVNMYGITETTVHVTYRPLAEGDLERGSLIGGPIPDLAVYLVDRALQPVPVGGPGEMLVAGAGVARGYLHRPDLTAARFVPDPFSGQPGARLYRSGDLARRRPDGDLEYLGRIDHQVKIRGFRIELGEIESALAACDGVREAVVLARPDGLGGSARLVAYVVPAGAAPEVGALRAALERRLPDYMVPAAWVFLDALPLTGNGKVDRGALPAPGEERQGAAETFVAPRTPTERAVARIWSDLLGLREIGVEDDFFELGGHSLLATRLITRLRETFGVDAPMADFFAHPTVAGVAAGVDAARGGAPLPEELLEPIPRISRAEPIPLSLGQERLWFLQRLEASPVYNVPAAVRLRGALDAEALAEALRAIVRRHEALRTSFPVLDGRPVQAIAPRLDLDLPVTDLTTEADPESAAQGIALAEGTTLFDLAAGPLVRARLLRLAADEHLLLLTLHHAVSDGWSLGVLLRELKAFYRPHHEVDREVPALEPLPVQYADWAVWQRQRIEAGLVEGQIAFWREKLAGAPPRLEIPTDRPRGAAQTFRGRRTSELFPAPLLTGAEALARRRGATLFMTLLGATATLLGRMSGQEDLVLGTPIANRGRSELEGLIGFFVNTLPLRVDLSGEPTFAELVDRLKPTVLAAFENQDVPFGLLVAELQPERNLAETPLFQVLFALQNNAMPAMRLDGLELEPVEIDTGTAKFELTLEAAATPAGLLVTREHNLDLFDEATVARLAGGFRRLLEEVCLDPDRPLGDLPLLSAAEREELLSAWQGPALDIHHPWPETSLPALFALQAARTPDALALVAGSERLTYAELAARAAHVADALRERGVGPETRVAVCLERDAWLVAALLGVLAAGGAYVPVDPAYPRERSAFMLADSGAALLVTSPELAAGLDGAAPETLVLDAASPLPPRPLAVSARLCGHNLAYLIYTSGSTGRPKGVAIEHRGAVALLRWAEDAFTDAEVAGVLAATSVCFDLSVFELFVPLSRGGAVILVRNALALAELPARGAVTLVNTVPSALSALLRAGGLPAGVRTVNLAGEPLTRELAERIHQLPGGPRLLNLYGPSEDTTYSTWEVVTREAHEPTIGLPVSGTRAWVLDREMRLLPAGAPGLLWLSGAGLARGYHGRPDLTADRFRPDPLSGEPGGRMYATGDLARRRADGRLDFLGRADQQVKVRGFRIEPGEVESALAAHPAVREAVVVARKDGLEDQRLVAYLVPAMAAPAPEELRRWLRDRLPEPMVPSLFVTLDALPHTPSGKVDRKALPRPEQPEPPALPPVHAPELHGSNVEETIAAAWREVLKVDRVGPHDNFFDLGGHSLLLAQVHERLCQALPPEVAARLELLDLFRHPTVAALAARLAPAPAAQTPAPAPVRSFRQTGDGKPWDIAVVGMAVRFPGSPDLDAFWRTLRDGVEQIRDFSDEELRAAGIDEAVLRDPAYVKRRPYLDGVEMFDPAFFGLSPMEAALMDPQHRLFLEVSWEALEHGGCDPGRPPGRVGVFAGAGMNSYVWSNLASHPELLDAVGGFQTMIGNDKDYVATRVSYKLDLKGPSVLVQTACSTSLVAIHLACRSLLDGECDAALAGGVTVRVPQVSGYHFHEGGIHSPDGHCRAFDADAQGTTGGSGAGAVLLKRLEDALADGDTIHAVIKGSGINNDGAAKVGYTAPSVGGQAAAITTALAQAGVEAGSIGYVEAHGTGTILGDPIEVAALAQALGQGDKPRAIGSVKTNIGHADAAAGVAGFVKAVLALQNRQIPPSLGFARPNPKIDFDAAGLFVADRLLDWEAGEAPRRAGVSSFGVGGTNVHMILEEAPRVRESSPARPGALLTLSARTPAALEAQAKALAIHLENHPEQELADVAWTLQTGRRAFEHRRTVVATDRAEAIAALSGQMPERTGNGRAASDSRPVIFLFPGQGVGYPGMGRGLYESEPVFREVVDRCAELARPLLAHEGSPDLRDLLFPRAGEEENAARQLERIALGQPALWVIEIATAHLWLSQGVVPSALIGHSVGEFAAACVAGVFSLEEALRLVIERSRLMQTLPPGAMLSVPLPEAEVVRRLEPFGGRISLAAVNAPAQCLAAGPTEEIDRLEEELRGEGVDVRRLRVGVAGHSWMNEPIVAPFAAEVAKAAPRAPRIPYVTNLTGTWVTAEQATNPLHWGRHLSHTVRFAGGLAELCAQGDAVLLEVGPGRSIGNLVRQVTTGQPATGRTILQSLRHPTESHPDRPFLLQTLGRLWLAGVRIDWLGVAASEERRRVPLPTYPFERQRCWIDPAPVAETRTARSSSTALRRRSGPAEWFHAPAWTRTLPQALDAEEAGRQTWLVLAGTALGRQVADRLRAAGSRAAVAEPGPVFARTGELDWVLPAGDAAAYERLLAELAENGALPGRVLHLWSLAAETGGPSTEVFDRAQELGFYSLLHLARALSKRLDAGPVRIAAAAAGLHEVTGGEPLRPAAATLAGPCLVIPMEHPELRCQLFDLPAAAASPQGDLRLAERLIAELAVETPEPVVAFRNGHRWVRALAPLPADRPSTEALPLRRGGVYLITGGLGRIGLVTARFLAREAGAKLALVGRTAPPPREEWGAWMDGSGETAERVRALLALEAEGAEVLPLAADVADPASLAAAVARVRERFGRIDGVFHGAGLIGHGAAVSVAASDRATCEPQLRPKAVGALVLEQVLAGSPLPWPLPRGAGEGDLSNEPSVGGGALSRSAGEGRGGGGEGNAPDFIVLYSSLSTYLGGLGYAAYAGANAFLDSWAQSGAGEAGPRRVSLVWEGWRFGEKRGAGLGATVEELSLTPEEGEAALARLFTTVPALSQVVVSTADPAARMALWSAPVQSAEAVDGGAAETQALALSRPSLAVAYVAPRDEQEERVAVVWRELLGIGEIGVHDDFFELGGHSVLATQLVARLRQALHAEIPLEGFFANPTVAGVAEMARRTVEESNAPDPDEQQRRLEEILAEIEMMTEEATQ